MATDFVRVKDPGTKHEYSAPRRFAEASKLEVLTDKEAVDDNGRPLPAKPYVELEKAETPPPADPPSEPMTTDNASDQSGRTAGKAGNR